jgi:hypothetical protein
MKNGVYFTLLALFFVVVGCASGPKQRPDKYIKMGPATPVAISEFPANLCYAGGHLLFLPSEKIELHQLKKTIIGIRKGWSETKDDFKKSIIVTGSVYLHNNKNRHNQDLPIPVDTYCKTIHIREFYNEKYLKITLPTGNRAK